MTASDEVRECVARAMFDAEMNAIHWLNVLQRDKDDYLAAASAALTALQPDFDKAARQAAEAMRERCLRIAEKNAGGQAFKRGAAIRIAAAIRALPLPGDEGNER